jgi:hypothetical protein
MLHAGLLLGLFFDPEDGADMFLRNVGWHPKETRRFIPENGGLHKHRLENLNLYVPIDGHTQRLRCGLALWIFAQNLKKFRSSRGVTPCSPLELYRYSGGKHELHLHGGGISEVINYSAPTLLVTCCLFNWHIILPWKWKQYVSPRCRYTSTRQNGITSHKMILFIVTVLRTPSLTQTNK